MANFYPWIDSSNTNVMSENDFKNDSQRTTGFVAGQAASSKRVNSALRQANLFVAALANIILGNDTTLNLTSSLNAVQTKLASSYPFNLTLWNKGNSGTLVGNSNTNSVNSNIAKFSTVFGEHNTLVLPQSFVAGAYNTTIALVGTLMPIFQLGTYLTNKSVSTTKFVTGQYNEDCGDCVRETGAGTANARKTVEKLDKDGTLYINRLALVTGNITEQTNLGNAETLNATTLEALNRLERIYSSAWQTKSTGSIGYVSLDEGTYLISVSKDGSFYDFGVVTLKKAASCKCPYAALVALASTSDPAAAWNYNVNGDFGVFITGTTGRVPNVTVRYKKIGEAW